MGDSICDIMMKEHEKFFKTHTVIHACSHKPKTPFQLDLEVEDRKPDIVPKVGDKVRIKSRAWYEKWKDENGIVDVPYTFVEKMSMYCGKIMTIRSVFSGFYLQEDDGAYTWSSDMFEEVYPQESSKEVKCSKAFESLGVNANALERQLTATSAIPAINPVQGIGIPTDWSKLVSGTETETVLHRRVEPDIPGIEKRIEEFRSILELNKEPELQTIKKHRFIKLENL